MRRYNIQEVAKKVVHAFIRFKIDNKLVISEEDAFNLLSYSVKSLYNMDCIEYSDTICEYGYDCIKTLKKINSIPKKLNLEDTVHLLDLVRGYFIYKSI